MAKYLILIYGQESDAAPTPEQWDQMMQAHGQFLMVDGTLQLGVALLFAALLGALLVLVAGAARVLQLRVVARRHRRTDQGP
jgi:hypothetical protein